MNLNIRNEFKDGCVVLNLKKQQVLNLKRFSENMHPIPYFVDNLDWFSLNLKSRNVVLVDKYFKFKKQKLI